MTRCRNDACRQSSAASLLSRQREEQHRQHSTGKADVDQTPTAPMCTHGIINSGLPPEASEEFDAFGPHDEESSDPIEDDHYAIFACSGYADAQDFVIFPSVGSDMIMSPHLKLSQRPHCNRLAKFFTLTRMLRMNKV